MVGVDFEEEATEVAAQFREYPPLLGDRATLQTREAEAS